MTRVAPRWRTLGGVLIEDNHVSASETEVESAGQAHHAASHFGD
jgi:hypothetical protein